MKKIGILTFWGVPNYGSFLQAYALRNSLEKLCPGDKIMQIAYLEDMHHKAYYQIKPEGYRYSIINPRFYIALIKRFLDRKNIRQKEIRFKVFYEQMPHTDYFTKNKLQNEEFDIVLLGSDIIWDYSIPFFNNDEFLFGNSLNSDCIASYAASFGTVKPNDAYPEYVKNGLLKQDFISVRDENSSQVVEGIIGKKPEVVADPTFLWDFENDIRVSEKKYDNYIVVYGSVFTKELIVGAIDYAKTHDLKLICLDSLDDAYDWCDINIEQSDLDPFKWLSLFKYADAVFTCTYHGLLFGLIFNKRLIFSPTQFILDKATSLMNDLGLYNVLVEIESFKGKIDWDWNYTEVNKKLDVLRKKSLNYLEGIASKN